MKQHVKLYEEFVGESSAGRPKDREKWNKMSKDQQNAVIDRMNKGAMSGSFAKLDKWKDYDGLHSDFHKELHPHLSEQEELNEDVWGMKKADHDALLDAAERKRYQPSAEKIDAVMAKFPNVSKADAIKALTLINSPARNTFTMMDVMGHLKKLNQEKK